MAENISRLAIEVTSDGVIKAASNLDELTDSGKKAEVQAGKTSKSLNDTGKSANVVKGKFGAMKGATQQVSYQLQDIAVQAQMGTSAFVILGQQGPQLASIFGPGGAVVGTMIAFGAMLGGVAFSMLLSAKNTGELEKSLKALGKEYGELTTAQQLLIKTQNDLEIKRLTKENGQLETQAVKTGQSLHGLAAAYGGTTEGLEGLTTASNDANVQIELNKERIKLLTNENNGLSKSTSDVVVALGLEYQMLGKTERQKALITAGLKNAKPEQIREINRLYDLIEGKKKDLDLDKQRSDQLKKEEADQKSGAVAAERRLVAAEGANDSIIEALRRRSVQQQAVLEQDRIAAVSMAEKTGADVLAINERYMEAHLAVEAGTNAKILEMNQKLTAAKEKAEATYMSNWMQRTEESMMNMDLLGATMAESLSSNLGNAFESFLTGASSAKEAFRDLATGMAKMLVHTLANMAAQWAAYWVVEKVMGKTAQATAGMAMGFNALATQQLAGISAFASTAAIPIVGPALAPAASAAAIAATAPFVAATFALGAAATGARALGGQVRGGESYLVGERGPELLTMGTSGRIATNENLKNAVGGGGGVTVINNIDATGSGPDVEAKIRAAMDQTSAKTIATIQDLMRRRRFA